MRRMKPTKDMIDLAYTEETRLKIIEFYKDDLMGITAAARAMIKDQQAGKRYLSEEEFLQMLFSTISGAFVLGFKQGNDLFLEEAEKVDDKKEEKK